MRIRTNVFMPISKGKILTSAFGLFGLGISLAQQVQPSHATLFEQVYLALSVSTQIVAKAEVDAAAIEGILTTLWPKVQLLDSTSSTRQLPVVRRLHDRYIQLHLPRLEAGASEQAMLALGSLTPTNMPCGVVLDLRFTDGWDYNEAGAFLGLFVKNAKLRLAWSSGTVEITPSTPSTNRLNELPIVVLMNSKTSGAAEALADAIRDLRRGILVGQPTAGALFKFTEKELGRSVRLRIATDLLTASQSTQPYRVVPDILVDVPLEDQLGYLEDPYTPRGQLAYLKDKQPAQRPSEADLTAPGQSEAAKSQGQPPVVIDPMLNRALDILRAIELVQKPK